MTLPQTELEYRNALIDAAELGAKKALEQAGLMRPYMKQREAYRLYGESVVKRWIKEGLLKQIKDGNRTSTVRIDRMQIETLEMTSNRATYLSTNERTQ